MAQELTRWERDGGADSGLSPIQACLALDFDTSRAPMKPTMGAFEPGGSNRGPRRKNK